MDGVVSVCLFLSVSLSSVSCLEVEVSRHLLISPQKKSPKLQLQHLTLVFMIHCPMGFQILGPITNGLLPALIAPLRSYSLLKLLLWKVLRIIDVALRATSEEFLFLIFIHSLCIQ